jgi:hypothetical protein
MLCREGAQPPWVAALYLLVDELHGLRVLVALSLFLVLLASALAALSPIIFKVLLDHISPTGPSDGKHGSIRNFVCEPVH